LEVQNAATREAVVGAEVFVGGVSGLPLAATDALGRTLVPVDPPEAGSLRLTIRTPDASEFLEVENRTGLLAVGEHFALMVIDADAPPPPLPTIGVIAGTKPPELHVGGYVDMIGVCSARTGDVIWEVAANLGFFIDQVAVGSVPIGFMDTTELPVSSGSVAKPCYLSLSDVNPNAFVVFAGGLYFGDIVAVDSYCLGTTGGAVECSNE
jgi:hypothetical protein